MAYYRHQRARSVEILGAFFIASISGARGIVRHSRIPLGIAALVSLYAVYRAVMLFARNPALAYDDKNVSVGRLAQVCDFKWSDVQDIREIHWTRPSIPYLNWLPKEREYLELQIQGVSPLKIRSDMMELPSGGVKQLIKDFRDAQAAALGERGAAAARLGQSNVLPPAAPASDLQAERWARLGIGTDSARGSPDDAGPPSPSRPSGPLPRPAFGRKGS
jgi:hypothetical protein